MVARVGVEDSEEAIENMVRTGIEDASDDLTGEIKYADQRSQRLGNGIRGHSLL